MQPTSPYSDSSTAAPNWNADPQYPLPGSLASTLNATGGLVLSRATDNQARSIANPSVAFGGSVAARTAPNSSTVMGSAVARSALTPFPPIVSVATTMAARQIHAATTTTLMPADTRPPVHLLPGHAVSSMALTERQVLQLWRQLQEQRHQRRQVDEFWRLVATAQSRARLLQQPQLALHAVAEQDAHDLLELGGG